MLNPTSEELSVITELLTYLGGLGDSPSPLGFVALVVTLAIALHRRP